MGVVEIARVEDEVSEVEVIRDKNERTATRVRSGDSKSRVKKWTLMKMVKDKDEEMGIREAI